MHKLPCTDGHIRRPCPPVPWRPPLVWLSTAPSLSAADPWLNPPASRSSSHGRAPTLAPRAWQRPCSERGSGLTKPVDILRYAWCGYRHSCVDLVGMSPARVGWRDATSALFSVEQGKSYKYARSHTGFTSLPSASRLLGPLALQQRSSQWEAHP